MWQKLNPLRTLRVRVGLLVLGVIAALAVFTTGYFSERLTDSYREAGRAQLGAIASLWDDSFRLRQLANPQGIQRRINALRQKNETLHKLSVSWHDAGGGTWLLQSGHEHDPDGTKRDVTGAVTRAETLANPAPIDERDFSYHEVRATDGAHYAELNYPLRRFRAGRRQLVGALELHYDLKQVDQALAADKRTLTMGQRPRRRDRRPPDQPPALPGGADPARPPACGHPPDRRRRGGGSPRLEARRRDRSASA